MQAVVADTAILELSLDSIRALPQNAFYRMKKGRVQVEVKRKQDGGIVVRANCDSLQRLCEMYALESSLWEERYTEISKQEKRQQKQERISIPGLGILPFLLSSLILSGVIYFIYKSDKK